jgi:hypothetical protein
MVSRVRLPATSAPAVGVPWVCTRWAQAAITGWKRLALSVALDRVRRTGARPPQVVRLPRRVPLAAVRGATLRSGQNYGEFIMPPPDAAGDGAGGSAERSPGARPAAAG